MTVFAYPAKTPVLLHDRNRRAAFEGLGHGIAKAPLIPGLEFLVRWFQPSVFDNRELPGTDDILAEQVTHEFESVPVVHGDGFQPISIGEHLLEILAGAIEGGDGQVLQTIPNIFGMLFHQGHISGKRQVVADED